MTDYNKQAKDFLEKTGTRIVCAYITTANYFPDEIEERDIYSVVVVRESSGKYLTFTYGDSLANTERNSNAQARRVPTAYDILSTLPTFQVPDSIDDFASEMGYTKPSVALRVYNEVKKQREQLEAMYSTPELEAMQEIR